MSWKLFVDRLTQNVLTSLGMDSYVFHLTRRLMKRTHECFHLFMTCTAREHDLRKAFENKKTLYEAMKCSKRTST
jgi:hypothetical protein